MILLVLFFNCLQFMVAAWCLIPAMTSHSISNLFLGFINVIIGFGNLFKYLLTEISHTKHKMSLNQRELDIIERHGFDIIDEPYRSELVNRYPHLNLDNR